MTTFNMQLEMPIYKFVCLAVYIQLVIKSKINCRFGVLRHTGIANVNNQSISIGTFGEPIHASEFIPAGIYTAKRLLEKISKFVGEYQTVTVTCKYDLDERNAVNADLELTNNADIDVELKMHRSLGRQQQFQTRKIYI